jgi:hypothetical protein
VESPAGWLILLVVLSLGVIDTLLGPKLPAFLFAAGFAALVKNFDLKPCTTMETDLARMVPAQYMRATICTLSWGDIPGKCWIASGKTLHKN